VIEPVAKKPQPTPIQTPLPVVAAIKALAEATRGMTHEQKINVMVDACKEVGVACSQVFNQDMQRKEKAGLVDRIRLS
jgi:hypothetical protein